MLPNKKILYLAPEIPALSATFVYNELLKLRELGLDVAVASVRDSTAKVDTKTEQKVGNVFVIYKHSFLAALFVLIKVFLMQPIKVVRSFSWLVFDLFSIGLFSRNALGLIYRYVYSGILTNHILNNNITHTHVHFAHIPTDIAMYAACMSGTDFSVTSHANDIFQRGWLLKEKIERSKFFVTISQFNKAYLTKLAPQIVDKINVIYCGVDTTKFTYRATHEKTTFTFGFLARLVEKKGVEYLIKACNELKKKRYNFKVEIVGDGPLTDELKALTSELGLTTHISFLGTMPNNQVSEWLKKLGAFVLPSVKDSNGDMDGIPVSLMEAMACGVPVISTDLSGIKELVINQQTGFLAKSANEQDLADKMALLLTTEPAQLNKLAEQAEKHVKQNFNQLANAEKIGQLIVKELVKH
ncbi:glycosyltransferase family 4 protein [Colwellia sp. Bg11-28]|uniref:glycosyltransferase family 4 protein n=1 Tax=Colwellia sp. Bg11-28 TaxID=2058305 RepID=UPI000C33FCE3|nr:glycosyltransferase family 4 protein [Colwellia sp. Bg11-28]PKH85173.1 colanic acid biosynthesis glycosyltransferase WcaL [Colwellia sp. Bg11-28]